MNTADIPPPRDEDELEGTLLSLPVATRVDEDRRHHDNFLTAIAEEHMQQQQQQQQSENVAYTIPRHEAAIADDSHSRVKLAERRGQIASEDEKEAIRNENRTAFSTNYFSSHAVEAANRRARLRDAEGLQVVERREVSSPPHNSHDANNEGHESRSSVSPNTTKARGYDVNEYSIRTDYKTSEYDTQEYRSVYE
jgi:hypothetical protein